MNDVAVLVIQCGRPPFSLVVEDRAMTSAAGLHLRVSGEERGEPLRVEEVVHGELVGHRLYVAGHAPTSQAASGPIDWRYTRVYGR
jgi:hypothetical protein